MTSEQGLAIVRGVAAQFPQLLQINTAASCYQFTTHVLRALKAAGDDGWGYVGKTAGEGQYTPPTGFPRSYGGYTLTGVSHDAIGSSTQRIDLLGGGNDGPEPLGQPARPQWVEIPREYWRPNNPILTMDAAVEPVKPVKPAYPGDAFFLSLGATLEADYTEADQSLNAGSAVWFARTIWDVVVESMKPSDAITKHRGEWRAALGLK